MSTDLFSPNSVFAHAEDVGDELQASVAQEFPGYFFSLLGGRLKDCDALTVGTNNDYVDHLLLLVFLFVYYSRVLRSCQLEQ